MIARWGDSWFQSRTALRASWKMHLCEVCGPAIEVVEAALERGSPVAAAAQVLTHCCQNTSPAQLATSQLCSGRTRGCGWSPVVHETTQAVATHTVLVPRIFTATRHSCQAVACPQNQLSHPQDAPVERKMEHRVSPRALNALKLSWRGKVVSGPTGAQVVHGLDQRASSPDLKQSIRWTRERERGECAGGCRAAQAPGEQPPAATSAAAAVATAASVTSDARSRVANRTDIPRLPPHGTGASRDEAKRVESASVFLGKKKNPLCRFTSLNLGDTSGRARQYLRRTG